MNFFIKIYDKISLFFGHIKVALKNLFSYFFIKVYFIIAYTINLFLWVAVYFCYSRFSQDIAILHYNIDFGIDLIGNKNYLFFIPISSLFFIIIYQIILSKFLSNNDFKFWSYFLSSFLLLFNIFLIFILFTIYYINF